MSRNLKYRNQFRSQLVHKAPNLFYHISKKNRYMSLLMMIQTGRDLIHGMNTYQE